MKRNDRVQLLCARYCSFYKPGKAEELACKGFIILDRLLAAGKEIPARTESIALGMKTEDDLFQLICGPCPFFKQDCDFAAWKSGCDAQMPREAVTPCGGFICLGDCLDQGTIDIEDINRVI